MVGFMVRGVFGSVPYMSDATSSNAKFGVNYTEINQKIMKYFSIFVWA